MLIVEHEYVRRRQGSVSANVQSAVLAIAGCAASLDSASGTGRCVWYLDWATAGEHYALSWVCENARRCRRFQTSAALGTQAVDIPLARRARARRTVGWRARARDTFLTWMRDAILGWA
jgi:hypothetical protein